MSWIAVGVTAVAAVGSAYVSKRGADKAADAQKKAIRSMKALDVEDAQEIATRYDREQFLGQFDLQKEGDPTIAEVRRVGSESLLEGLKGDQKRQGKTDQIFEKLIDENKDEDPRLTRIRDKLLYDVETELNAGASLPPEFQAELMRAGLESANRSGFDADGRFAAGGVVRKLLGKEGIELQAFRRQQATGMLGVANNLRNERVEILSKLLPAQSALAGETQRRAASGVLLGDADMPEYGLSGADAVNLEQAKYKMNNEKALAIGNLKAQKAQNRAAFINSMIGAASGFAGGAAGGMGGAASSGGTGSVYSALAQSLSTNRANKQQAAWGQPTFVQNGSTTQAVYSPQ